MICLFLLCGLWLQILCMKTFTVIYCITKCNVIDFNSVVHDVHNASEKCPTMHHFVTEMCTCGTLWDIGLMHCGIYESGVLFCDHAKTDPCWSVISGYQSATDGHVVMATTVIRATSDSDIIWAVPDKFENALWLGCICFESLHDIFQLYGDKLQLLCFS